MIFNRALEIILEHEGGYVFDPRDAGGETKYGISKRAFPDLDIPSLTIEQAGEIYKRDYWDACRCDELPPALALQVFDFAVNAGVVRASKTLQEAVGVYADGIIGPRTLAHTESVYKLRAESLLYNYSELRINHYTRLKTFDAFGKGWTKRTFKTLSLSIQMFRDKSKWTVTS